MPGITGIIAKNPVGNEKTLVDQMLSVMLHESFYTRGIYSNDELGLFVGFTAIESSFADCMPIRNETGDLILFLTGECYFDRSTIDDLKRRNHSFDEQNGSMLVHLYEETGDKFFGQLNGWFNGLLVDLRRKRVTLFNDRCGIRRIYYHENKNFFYFGSEAKSLLKILPEMRQMDPQSVGEYIVYDCVLENRTYFSNMSLLPSGSAWTFEKTHIEKKVYHDPAMLESLPKIPHESFFEEFCSIFDKILPRYFRGYGIGMSLTGGLDTRAIMANCNLSPGMLPCYTFGGKYKDIFDVRLAPKVAADCGQPHTILRMNDADFLQNFEYHAERSMWVTDGVVPVVMSDMMQFNKMAREIAPIRMTGKYGSQVLKNVFAFKDRSPHSGLISPDFEHHLRLASDTAKKLSLSHSFSFLLSSEIPWWWNGMLSAEASQLEVRSPYLDNDLIELLYRGQGPQLSTGVDLQLDLIGNYRPSLLAIPTTGTHGGTVPIISGLKKMIIKTFTIADKLYIRERLPYSLTQAVGYMDKFIISPLHLDRLFFGYTDFRRYRQWFRKELSGYLTDIILNSKTLDRPYWNKDYLRTFLFDHIGGKGTYLRELRKVLQVELLHRVLLEKW